MTLPTVVAFLALVVAVTALFRTVREPKPRLVVRDEYAARAAAYAEQLGGTPGDKLRHAVQAFGMLDQADNGRRDYTDGEARIAIEAHLNKEE